jgi:hypothetical protein
MSAQIKCRLVSFADGAGFPSRRPVLTDEARASGFFEDVAVHSLVTLPSAFRERHETYMRSTPRGFGYYIWKPVVVLEALERAQQDDVILYLDAGFKLNPTATRRFREYLEMTLDDANRMLSFLNVYTEAHWTKADLSARLGLAQTDSQLRTSQFGSGMFFLTKTRSNLDLVKAWADLAVQDAYHYSDDTPSVQENHPDFVEHRHDQSIFSLLRKQRGTAVTHYEVQAYSGAFDRRKHAIPAWAMRLRS